MEELYESEVMWPNSNDCRPTGASDRWVPSKTKARARGCSTTAAMAIPNRTSTSRRWGVGPEENKDNNNNDDDYEEDDTEFTPPHILTSRSSGSSGGSARKVAFSLCSGQGRTLKGRDLSYVRNSVLRMTGFLEM